MTVAFTWQELALVYARIGATSFGGPQAQIAMQHEEVVAKRQWLSDADFWAGVALFEVLPGPSATQTGIYIGYTLQGWLGAILAGVSAITPAFIIEVILSWAYFRWQGLAALAATFLGLAPLVIAILLAFCWRSGKSLLLQGTGRERWVRVAIATAALILMLYRVNVALVLLLAGLIGLGRSRLPSLAVILPWPLLATVAEPLSVAAIWDWSRLETYLWPLFSFFFKTGSLVFGGGLVIIPFIETEVVEQLGWLTPQEFLDGVAIGQLSPGPVVLTSAFIGYKVAGVPGAFVAALAIFLPSFIFVGLGTPILLAIKQQPLIRAFLAGVLPAVLGVIAATTMHLAQSAWLQPVLGQTLGAIAITGVALVAIVRFRVPTWQLVLGGMVAGLALSRLA